MNPARRGVGPAVSANTTAATARPAAATAVAEEEGADKGTETEAAAAAAENQDSSTKEARQGETIGTGIATSHGFHQAGAHNEEELGPGPHPNGAHTGTIPVHLGPKLRGKRQLGNYPNADSERQ